MANNVVQIKEYFASGGKPVTAKEFKDFWTSLNDEEKDYYKDVDLVSGEL